MWTIVAHSCPAAAVQQAGGTLPLARPAAPPSPRPRILAQAGGETVTKLEARFSAPRPHIVMAVFDDLGYNDLSSLSGGKLTPRTPFMDELMAGGIKLKNFYASSYEIACGRNNKNS